MITHWLQNKVTCGGKLKLAIVLLVGGVLVLGRTRGGEAGALPYFPGDPAIETAGELHPYHVSYAEMEWNPDSQSLEIALHVWPIDLEEALESLHQEELSLDDAEVIDPLIHDYLADRFRVLSTDGKAASIKWLGKEVGIKSAWLYFEIPLEKEPEGYEIEYRLFFEHLEEQVNTIRYRTGRRRMTLRFVADKPRQKLDYELLRVGL